MFNELETDADNLKIKFIYIIYVYIYVYLYIPNLSFNTVKNASKIIDLDILDLPNVLS